MTSDAALWLAQVQSFFSLGFMVVFAALSLGLAWLLAWFRLCALPAQADLGWRAAYRFWVRIFALALTLAVFGGVVLLIQLPGLWPGLPERMSEITSPVLALAVVGVFVVSVCFLGPMLFAERRLSPRLHAAAVVLVALGVTLVLAALVLLCSWMQTPAGAAPHNGEFRVHDWGQVLLSPAMPWLAGLTLAASLLCAACVVLAVTAWQTHAHPTQAGERLAFRSSLIVGLFSSVVLGLLLAGSARMDGVHPVDNATAIVFFSMRGAWLLGGVILLVLVGVGVLRRCRSPADLSRAERVCLIWMGGAAACLLLLGVARLVFGAWPFAVQGVIALEDVVTDASAGGLAAVLAASLVVYGALLTAFMLLLRFAARYGVVPVARLRGRA